MMEFEPDEINLVGFDRFVKAVKSENQPYAKIGILGKNVMRSGKGDVTNSEIGAAHEYGSPERGLPSRSFLRMPLTDQLPSDLEESKVFSDDVLKEVVKQGSLIPWMHLLAALAVGTVKKAFASNGFGKWTAWLTPGYTNNTGDILVDTRQLRNSITEEVVENP